MFGPWLAIRLCAGAIVNDAAITRPREAPSMTEIIFGFARVGLVYAVAAELDRNRSSNHKQLIRRAFSSS